MYLATVGPTDGEDNLIQEPPRLVRVSAGFSLIKTASCRGRAAGGRGDGGLGGAMRRFRRRLGAATRSQLTDGNTMLNSFRHSNCFRLISCS